MAQVGTISKQAGAPADGGGEDGAGAVVGRTPWQIFWRRFRKDKFAIAGAIFIVLLVLMAICAPLISHLTGHGPDQLFPFTGLDEYGLPLGPSKHFWFGVDSQGHDLFVRVMYGARTSLIVAIFATGIEVVIGTILGVAAGFYRGKIDTVISRIMDIVLSLPVLLLALGLVSACGFTNNGCLGGLIKPGLLLVSYVIGLFSWPYIARIVRGQVLSVREKEFIEAARAGGAGDIRIMWREVMPNLVAPLVVYSTLIIPTNVLFEATLSYLGIGVPATTPSWGGQLSDASQIFNVAWWTMFFPGMFLLGTTLAFNLVGDGMRDALDPKTAALSYKKESSRKQRKRAEAAASEQTAQPAAA